MKKQNLILNKIVLLVLAFVLLIPTQTRFILAEGYTSVRVKFTYTNYYIEFPQEVAVGKDVVVYRDTLPASAPYPEEYLRYTIPAEGFEETAYKDFGEVDPNQFERDGFNLTWKYRVEDGNLLIYPTYVAKPTNTNSPENSGPVNYSFKFRHVEEVGGKDEKLPWYFTLKEVLDSGEAKSLGLDADFTKQQQDDSLVRAWLKSYQDRVTDDVDLGQLYVAVQADTYNPNKAGTYVYMGSRNNPILGYDKEGGQVEYVNNLLWKFEHKFPVLFIFESEDSTLTLPEEVLNVKPESYLSEAYQPVSVEAKTFDDIVTNEGTWSSTGYEAKSVASLEDKLEVRAIWTFDEKPTLTVTPTTELTEGGTLDLMSLATAASDKEDGDLTSKIALKDNGGFDASVPGVYTVTFKVTDSKGNVTTATSTVTVNEKPKYTISYEFMSTDGEQTLPAEVLAVQPTNATITSKEAFSAVEPSKTSVQVADGTWTFEGYEPATIDSVEANMTVVGKWSFDEKPTLIVAESALLTQGNEFDLKSLVLKAVDSEDGTLTAIISDDGGFDANKVGTYTVTFKVTDSKGNVTTATSTVTVNEKKVPVVVEEDTDTNSVEPEVQNEATTENTVVVESKTPDTADRSSMMFYSFTFLLAVLIAGGLLIAEYRNKKHDNQA